MAYHKQYVLIQSFFALKHGIIKVQFPMPELPEVESIRHYISNKFVNKKIISLQFLRLQHGKSAIVSFPKNNDDRVVAEENKERYAKKFSGCVAGGKLVACERRGKFLLLRFSSTTDRLLGKLEPTMVLHLRMSGVFVNDAEWQVPAGMRKHRNFTLNFEFASLHFIDARTFATVQCFFDFAPAREFVEKKKLGVDALSVVALKKKFALPLLSRMPIKNYLLNQQMVLGLGNIYASESLFLAGISPWTSTATLTHLQLKNLSWCIAGLMHFAIAKGGVTIEKNTGYRLPNGKRGGYMAKANVYGRTNKLCVGRKIALGNLANFYYQNFLSEHLQIKPVGQNSQLKSNGIERYAPEKKSFNSINFRLAKDFYEQFLKLAKTAEKCDGIVKKMLQAGRSSYYCNKCQK